MGEGDDALLRAELEAAHAAMAALQRNFDDFQESSRELEEELEAELGRAQDQVSELTNRIADVTERLGDQQAKSRSLAGEVAAAQTESVRLRTIVSREAAEKAALEQVTDELEAKLRAAVAAEEDFRHKLDLAIEEKIFVSNDLEDLRAEALRTEQNLRSDIEDLQQELGRLGNRGAGMGSGGTTPSLILPSSMATPTISLDNPNVAGAAADGAAAGGFEGDGELNGSFHGAARDPEAADDLIKALEEEVEALTAQLHDSEAANDDLNLELQDMQEQLLDRGDTVGGVAAGGILASADKEGVGSANGDGNSGRRPTAEIYETELASLKEELSEAMAMCEELDQTVTDLTDELHNKDEQRGVLDSRLTELEGELGSRTQSLEDEVSKAKTGASSLAARAADAEAELRASNGRLEHASSKAAAAQEREGKLREELASLRERVSELTSSNSSISIEARSREAHLEEAVATTEKLRDENANLRSQVDSLTALLADEADARRLAEKMAEDRLQAEITAERQRSAGVEAAAAATAAAAAAAAAAVAAAETAATTAADSAVAAAAAQTTAGLAAAADGGSDNATGPRSSPNRRGAAAAPGRSSSEENRGSAEGGMSGRGGGQGEGQSSGEPAAGGSGGGEVRIAATGQASAGEKELGQQVVRLKKALEDARRASADGRAGAGGGAGGVDGLGSAVLAALDSENLDMVKAELRALSSKYVSERGTNASLLSKIRALKGNIEVICRIRPPTVEETAAGVPIALEALGDGEVGVKIAKDTARPGGQPGSGATSSAGGQPTSTWRSFTLDKALGPSTTQEEVFRQVEPLALSAADGMNACIFAYGQTGSGKTHTMIGDSKGGEMAGVSYRTMNKLFRVLGHRQRQQPDYKFTVRVAMLEIYNEDVRDLLASYDASTGAPVTSFGSVSGAGSGESGGSSEGSSGGVAGKLEIRRGPEGMIQVPGLTHVTVSSAEEVLKLLELGGSARAVAATGVHDHSSRSHSVLLAEVASRAGPDALPATGRLFLVDLAGSERIKVSGVTGAGLREATAINSSLSALGDVMQALDQKHKHVPYRNSKLTFLLQDALGGNSRTAMVVTVCPTSLNVDESLFALQFAARARNVSLGPAQRNVGAKNLLEEAKELRARLREAGRKKEHAEEALANLQREHARSQQKNNALLDARAKNVGDLRSQLEAQIDSLKKQLADTQANVLEERSKRATLQADAEDYQRQLKRSIAKVAALGRDREEREAKLHSKKEEIGELKAELRKTVSEAKNTVRRLSAGRSNMASGAGAFGFTPRGTGVGGDGMAPGKGAPHTPSKKLSEAKSRYARMREGSASKLPSSESAVVLPPSPESSTTFPITQQRLPRGRSRPGLSTSHRFSPEPPTLLAEAKMNNIDVAKARSGAPSTVATESVISSAPSNRSLAVEGTTDDIGATGSVVGRVCMSEGVGGILTSCTSDVTDSVASGHIDDNVREENRDVYTDNDTLASLTSGGEQEPDNGGEAADAAAAIAAATAIFARASSGSGPCDSMKEGLEAAEGRADRRGSLLRPRSGSGPRIGLKRTSSGGLGINSRLTRATASSTARLRVSAPPVPAFDVAASVEPSAAKTSRRASARHFGALEDSAGPASSRNRPPSPPGRVPRSTRVHSSSSNSSSDKTSLVSGSSRSNVKQRSMLSPSTRAARSSISGQAGGGAVTTTASRRATQPPSPAAGAVGGTAGTGKLISSRASVGHTAKGVGSKGWLGERVRATSLHAPSAAVAAVAEGEEATDGSGGGGTGGRSRAQIALKRHQERMDRIREKREERKGGGGKDATS